MSPVCCHSAAVELDLSEVANTLRKHAQLHRLVETYSLFLLSITAAVSIQTLKSRRENCAARFRLKHDLIALVAHLPHRTSCKYTSDIWQAESVSLAANDSIWPHGHLVLSASARVSCKGQRANLKRRSWFTCATLENMMSPECWVRPTAPPLFEEEQGNHCSRTSVPARKLLRGVFLWLFFFLPEANVHRQANWQRGRRTTPVSWSGYTVCNPVLPGRRSSPQPFSHSKCEPDLKERTVKKKNALCFLFNHTLLDVITPFLCLMTRAVWTEARYSSSQTPDCACRSEASWRRWGGSSWCGRGGEKAGRARNIVCLAWPAILWGTVFYSLPTRIADQPITWQQLNALRHVEAVKTTCLLSVSLAVCLSSEHQNENGEERRLKWIQTWSMWLFARSSPVLTESGPGRGE